MPPRRDATRRGVQVARINMHKSCHYRRLSARLSERAAFARDLSAILSDSLENLKNRISRQRAIAINPRKMQR